MYDGIEPLPFSPALDAALSPVWERIKTRVTPLEWRLQAPLIAAIIALKREKNAVISTTCLGRRRVTKSLMAAVEPAKSATSSTSAGHSGWASTWASG